MDRFQKLSEDIEAYRQAIENAEGALAEAERELNEALTDAYGETNERSEERE